MSVFKMKDKPHGEPRKLPWCCELPNGTGKRKRTYFKTKPEAVAYEAKEKERQRTSRTGMHSIQDLRKYTAGEIVEGYIASEGYVIRDDEYDCPDPDATDLYENYFLVLWKFSRNKKYAPAKLYDFNKGVAEQYRDDMLSGGYISNGSSTEKKYSPRTVRRNITIIQRAWKWARKNNPALMYLDNPWEGLKVDGATGGKRQRGLRKGELEKLIEACKTCRGTNRYYVPVAIYLTIETAMRRREMIDLCWDDVDFETKRITIRASKTDKKTGNKGRVIVLTFMAEMMLSQLAVSLLKDGCLPGEERTKVPEANHPPKGRIFPMSGDALSDAFDGAAERAGIEDLNFHDLRAAAEAEFVRADLNPKQIDIMKNGPKSHYDVVEVYLEIIEKKLELHRLKGKTVEEIEIELKEEELQLVQDAIEEGLSQEAAVLAAKTVMKMKTQDALAKAGLVKASG